MSNTEKNSNLLNDIFEAQSKMVDQMVESAKSLTKNVPFVNETLDKGHQLYKEGVDKSKEWAGNTTHTLDQNKKNMNDATSEAQKYFTHWFENQMNLAKTMFNNAQYDGMAKTMPDWTSAWNEFMAKQNNWYEQMNNYWSQFAQKNPWMQNGMAAQNPYVNMMMNQFANQQTTEQMNQWFNQIREFSKSMNYAYEDWSRQINGMTSKDAFRGMSNMHEHLERFFELWAPMVQMMNDRTFQTSRFFDTMNTEKFKEFMDSFFKFMPDEQQKNMHMMNEQFIHMMKSMNMNYGQAMNDMSRQMFNMMPMAGTNPFPGMWEMYSSWKNAMNEAVSPLTRVAGNNQQLKDGQTWSEISDLMATFQLKNSELQYMIYQNGLTVMNKLADKVSTKLKAGEQIDSVVNLYKDWLMIGDETFTQLFNSDAYSKLMTEVSSLQMKIKQKVDQQMESIFLSNLPLATRTEMDEVYKSLYDLRKLYHNMEKMMRTGVKVEEPAAQTKKTAGKK